jgi:type II secretory pathway pseudopilin PulG
MMNDELKTGGTMKAEHTIMNDELSICAGVQPSSFSVHRSEGYAFVVLMVACTVMLIALAAALPSVYHESRREKEEELIFRGNEYSHAIYLFQRQFQRYPKSVDELIRTNNLRFLRHAYKDPMTPSGKWRFIHVGPGGALVDSLTMGPQQQPQLVGASGQSPRSSFQSSSTLTLGGNQDEQGAQGIQSAQGAQADQSAQGGQNSQGDQKDKPKIRPGCEDTKSESAFSSDSQVMGALIAGVASCNNKTSIRVYNKKTKYEEWEFLGVAFQATGLAGIPQPQAQPQPQQPGTGSPSTPGTPGTQPNPAGQPGGFGGSTFGPGSNPAGGIQPPPDTPLTDQPAPEQPQAPGEGEDTPQ